MVKAKRRLAGMLAACMTIAAMATGAASADSVTVATDRLNIRAQADAGSDSISVAGKGETMSFVSSGSGWVQVKYNGKTGYVSEEYVKLDSGALEADVKANTEAFSAVGITTDRVNIRSLPRTTASIVKVAPKKGQVEITGKCGAWYQVKYSGKTGYLMAQYVTLSSGGTGATAAPEATAAPGQETAGSEYEQAVSGRVTVRVNMRESASTGSAIVCVLNVGDSVTLLGENGSWYRVSSGGREGYIVKTCAEPVSGDSSSDSSSSSGGSSAGSSSADSETVYEQTKTGTATDRVNMRQSPSTSAKIVKVVSKGQKVTVEGENGSWYKVSMSGSSGYISKSYLSIAADGGAGSSGSEDEKGESYAESKAGRTTARVNMRKSASTGASVVTVLSSGTSVTVTGEQGDFYQVKYGSRSGYVAKAYVQITASGGSSSSEDSKQETTVSETLYSQTKNGVTTVRVNMRATPEGDVLHALAADTAVTLLGESGSWYKVKYAGSTGYISKSYVTEKKASDGTEGSGKTGYITTASVNMRKGPGTGYGVIKVLKSGTEIQYYSLSDGWYLIKSGSDTGYVSSKYVSSEKPSSTTTGSSGSTSPTGSVILSDWFKGDIQKVFERGDTATVTDIKTGLKFQITRTGGNYHADVQPLTASDTKIMYKIYDNTWQWTRRAIWVTVDGKTYAASMNGMPHGETDTVPGNNFDGCFCVHFLNSKTHEGNRVDSAHQACIKEAYAAGK